MVAIRSKFGITAGDALKLIRQTNRVGAFIGEGPRRFYMSIPKAAMIKHLKMRDANEPLPCELEIGHGLYFGGSAARLHAERVDAARRRATPTRSQT